MGGFDGFQAEAEEKEKTRCDDHRRQEGGPRWLEPRSGVQSCSLHRFQASFALQSVGKDEPAAKECRRSLRCRLRNVHGVPLMTSHPVQNRRRSHGASLLPPIHSSLSPSSSSPRVAVACDTPLTRSYTTHQPHPPVACHEPRSITRNQTTATRPIEPPPLPSPSLRRVSTPKASRTAVPALPLYPLLSSFHHLSSPVPAALPQKAKDPQP